MLNSEVSLDSIYDYAIEWIKTEDGSMNNVFKSYPLSEEKASELAAKMYGGAY